MERPCARRPFTFRYSTTLGGFDDTDLTHFTRDKEVISFREHFFTVNEVPHPTCVLVWQDAILGQAELEAARTLQPDTRPHPSRSAARTDPTAGLSEPERVLFNSLRDWRLGKAHDEGVPPFVIFTNRHLLEIVRRRLDGPAALGRIHGIGPAKVKRYGAALLALLESPHHAIATAESMASTETPLFPQPVEPAP